MVPKTMNYFVWGRAFVRIPKAGAHPSTTNMLEYVPASVVSPFFVARWKSFKEFQRAD